MSWWHGNREKKIKLSWFTKKKLSMCRGSRTWMIATRALVTSEADATSAMRHRLCQVDRAIRKDTRSCKIKWISKWRKLERYRQEVQAWLFAYSCMQAVDEGLGGCGSRIGGWKSGGHRCKKFARKKVHWWTSTRQTRLGFMDKRRRQKFNIWFWNELGSLHGGFLGREYGKNRLDDEECDEAC